jgi:hypothetical protein
MSDYLSSLAARTLRREPAGEPRRAQMFEPRRETPDSPFIEEVREGLPGAETFEGGAAETPTPPAPHTPTAPAVYELGEGKGNEPRAQSPHHPAPAKPPHVEGDKPEPAFHEPPRHAEAPRPPASAQLLNTPHGALESEAAGRPPAPPEVKGLPQAQLAAPSSPVGVFAEDVADTSRPLAPSAQSATQVPPATDPGEASARTLRADVFDEGGREQAPAVVLRPPVEPDAARPESKGSTTVAGMEVVAQPSSRPPEAVAPAEVRPVLARPSTPTARATTLPAQAGQAAPPSREADAQAPPQPPTIEVTIGRIEVRAVTPPPAPAPPPQRQAPPKMSLDDYLRAQSGGRS